MSKEINFHKTSNMCIEIKEFICQVCEESFYELDGHELDECPLCCADFSRTEPTENSSDSDTYMLVLDPATGVPSILKRDEATQVYWEVSP